MAGTPSPFRVDVSNRINRLPPYLFARINKLKHEKRVAGIDIIDLGMGNPSDATPQAVVDKLAEAARDPRNHRYSVSNGIVGLRKEVAEKYRNPNWKSKRHTHSEQQKFGRAQFRNVISA